RLVAGRNPEIDVVLVERAKARFGRDRIFVWNLGDDASLTRLDDHRVAVDSAVTRIFHAGERLMHRIGELLLCREAGGEPDPNQITVKIRIYGRERGVVLRARGPGEIRIERDGCTRDIEPTVLPAELCCPGSRDRK